MKALLAKLRLTVRGEWFPRKRESGSFNISVLAPARSGMSFVDQRHSRTSPSGRKTR